MIVYDYLKLISSYMTHIWSQKYFKWPIQVISEFIWLFETHMMIYDYLELIWLYMIIQDSYVITKKNINDTYMFTYDLYDFIWLFNIHIWIIYGLLVTHMII